MQLDFLRSCTTFVAESLTGRIFSSCFFLGFRTGSGSPSYLQGREADTGDDARTFLRGTATRQTASKPSRCNCSSGRGDKISLGYAFTAIPPKREDESLLRTLEDVQRTHPGNVTFEPTFASAGGTMGSHCVWSSFEAQSTCNSEEQFIWKSSARFLVSRQSTEVCSAKRRT